jgi:hypothetical protein
LLPLSGSFAAVEIKFITRHKTQLGNHNIPKILRQVKKIKTKAAPFARATTLGYHTIYAAEE